MEDRGGGIECEDKVMDGWWKEMPDEQPQFICFFIVVVVVVLMFFLNIFY